MKNIVFVASVCEVGTTMTTTDKPSELMIDKLRMQELTERIADAVFPHVSDRDRRDDLQELLAAFAEEIKRSAIEP